MLQPSEPRCRFLAVSLGEWAEAALIKGPSAEPAANVQEGCASLFIEAFTRRVGGGKHNAAATKRTSHFKKQLRYAITRLPKRARNKTCLQLH
jgi:hypothetical protein